MTPREESPRNADTDDAAAARRQIASLRDSLSKALADLERAESALVATQTELDVTRHQIRTMRLSRAWRITAPVRRIKRRIARGDSW